MRLPNNIIRFIGGATEHALDEIERLIAIRREELSAPPDPPASKKREVVKVKKVGKLTIQSERVYCGKQCRGCPHGPYDYAYWREGGKIRSKYLGKTKA
jgi:hypothetical protein